MTADAPWVQTHTGLRMDLECPKPEDVHMHDIVVALSRIPRFNGHTIEPFSVAQHSLLVLRILDSLQPDGQPAPPDLRLAALLHDAHEAYIGDITSPVAMVLGRELRLLKDRVQDTIRAAFEIPYRWDAETVIRHCDLIALATEKRDLMGPEPFDWGPLPEPWQGGTLDLHTRYDLARLFGPTLTLLAGEVAR